MLTINNLNDLLKLNEVPKEFIYNNHNYILGGSSAAGLNMYFDGTHPAYIQYSCIDDNVSPSERVIKISFRTTGMALIPDKVTISRI